MKEMICSSIVDDYILKTIFKGLGKEYEYNPKYRISEYAVGYNMGLIKYIGSKNIQNTYVYDDYDLEYRESYQIVSIDVNDTFKKTEKVIECFFEDDFIQIAKLRYNDNREVDEVIIYNKDEYPIIKKNVIDIENKLGIEIKLIKCWEGVL